jgi:NAD(P)-dependent dehydrogenase (short-subunit alcohol dehydrogenase family)
MGRNALITGATRGIGLEVARQLSRAGFSLYLNGRDENRLAAVQEELGCGGRVADLRDPEAVVGLYRAAREDLGQLDVLVNNAGFNKAKDPLERVTVEDLDESYAVNLRAVILLSREALGEMGARGHGHIVNVLSSIVHARMENYSVYTTMKCGLHGFTGCLIKEARKQGVKVTGVYPGGVDTEFRAQARPDYLRAASAARMIVDCILAPDDVVVHEITYRPMVESNF